MHLVQNIMSQATALETKLCLHANTMMETAKEAEVFFKRMNEKEKPGIDEVIATAGGLASEWRNTQNILSAEELAIFRTKCKENIDSVMKAHLITTCVRDVKTLRDHLFARDTNHHENEKATSFYHNFFISCLNY